MLKNYLITAFRNFFKNRNYTFINMTGLTVGIASCLVIFLVITYDLKFDRFHANYDRIYRVVVDSKTGPDMVHSAVLPYPFVSGFRNDFPDVPLVTQIHLQSESMVRIGEDKHMIEDIVFADSLFFEVFDFKVLSGNPKEALGKPGKVFLTRSMAEKFLQQDASPSMRIDNLVDIELAGIVEDPPPTSHLQFSMIVSYSSFSGDFIGGFPLDHWGLSASAFCYLVLPEDNTVASIDDRFKEFVKKYHDTEEGDTRAYSLQPLKDIHFDETYTGGADHIRMSELVLLGVLAAFIITIACINFVNLATALAVRKSKEIGVRKTLGAGRTQITSYFVGETLLLTVIAAVVSLCIIEWILPWINAFLERKLDLDLLADPSLVIFLLVLIVVVTLLSGLYPAAILARYNPVTVLKNRMTKQGSSSIHLRKVLVVFQFTVAQVLIMATLIISDQMAYFKNKPLGFDKEAVITVPMPDNSGTLLESFRARVENHPGIQSLSFSVGAPTSDSDVGTGYGFPDTGREERYGVNLKLTDRHYLETYGLKLKAGRWFTESDEKKATEEGVPEKEREYVYILNESAVKRLGMHDPEEIIGRQLISGLYDIKAEVVGVVEDFHVASFHEKIDPVILTNFPGFYYSAGIKVKPDNFRETLAFIKEQWTTLYPEYYFDYEFLDDHLASLYRQEERTFTLFKIFAGISIFIGCLGLYGLISFMANQKVKEVGIRKVMGASVPDIMVLFSKEFVFLIFIAFVLATPLAWYFMDKWLEGFVYHVNVSWLSFLAGLVATVVIALLTVGYRSVRAATSNPVDALRTE